MISDNIFDIDSFIRKKHALKWVTKILYTIIQIIIILNDFYERTIPMNLKCLNKYVVRQIIAYPWSLLYKMAFKRGFNEHQLMRYFHTKTVKNAPIYTFT